MTSIALISEIIKGMTGTQYFHILVHKKCDACIQVYKVMHFCLLGI